MTPVRDVDGSDLSQIYHEVLERIVRDLIREKLHWSDFEGDHARQRIAALTAQIGQKLRDELMVSTGRNRYLLDYIERTLHLVAGHQKAASEPRKFPPRIHRCAIRNRKLRRHHRRFAPRASGHLPLRQ